MRAPLVVGHRGASGAAGEPSRLVPDALSADYPDSAVAARSSWLAP